MGNNEEPQKYRHFMKHFTFTKIAVKWLLILGALNGMMPFILSATGHDPVPELGIAWITEIVAVILGYLCKSYFETKAEKDNEIEQRKLNAEANCNPCEEELICEEEIEEESDDDRC